MGAAVTVLGGPLDGAVLPLNRRASLVYIDQETNMCYLRPGPRRLLHRLTSDHAVYSALTHCVCDGCGALHQRSAACQLCGTPLRRT